MIKLKTPITHDDIKTLKIGDKVSITGEIYTGRDAALPRLVNLIKSNNMIKKDTRKKEKKKKNDNSTKIPFSLNGAIILHTAVSKAGISPTSSNKDEIESSIIPLSNAGVKIHIGKGKLKEKTINELKNSIFIIIPSVAALLSQTVISKEVMMFEEEGIEAIFKLNVKNFPGIIAASDGKSIF
jgi:fumarate hydratase subunit beta